MKNLENKNIEEKDTLKAHAPIFLEEISTELFP